MKFWNKKWNLALSLFMALSIMAAGVVGCTEEEGNNEPEDTTVLLTVVDGGTTKEYTLTELKALGITTGEGGILTSVGGVVGPFDVTGSVSLADILDDIGGLEEGEAVRVTAEDGYAMTFSYNQVTEGTFTNFDAVTTAEVASVANTLTVLYELDGTALDDSQGPLRLGILSETGTITEGHWWVKWVVKIEIVTAEPEAVWTLTLDGASQLEVDDITFALEAALDAHGVTWTDDESNEWTGIPLWVLVSWVDDDDANTFNDALAAAGYEVKVIASDGYSKTFDIADIAGNDAWIVAFLLNGEPLDEDTAPLKLVGEGLTGGQKVSMIVTIQLILS